MKRPPAALHTPTLEADAVNVKSEPGDRATYRVNLSPGGWGECPGWGKHAGLLGPVGSCGVNIGQIGYSLGARVVCFGCITAKRSKLKTF